MVTVSVMKSFIFHLYSVIQKKSEKRDVARVGQFYCRDCTKGTIVRYVTAVISKPKYICISETRQDKILQMYGVNRTTK